MAARLVFDLIDNDILVSEFNYGKDKEDCLGL